MTNGGTPEAKSFPERDVLRRTVEAVPTVAQNWGPVGTLTWQLASVADEFVPWGRTPWRRDRQLREFWPTEPYLAGALRSVAQAYATFSWKIDGPPRTATAVQDMLHAANLGKGWLSWAYKTIIDLKTQDNGAFTEIIRETDSETSAVIGIAHKDAERCQRTGDPTVPVIYRDRNGGLHKLKWYQVITWEDMPSPVETMNDMQYSALTCVLRAAQILRDISIYKREKIGARGPSSIHLISGVSQARIEDATKKADETGDNQALMRYIQPTILASLDPNATVSHEEIPIKSLPDGFDEDVALRWYIAELALGFGQDYQDFAPLPGGGLGTSNQSEILNRKSHGKGPGAWMKLVEHKFNFHGVLPQSCTFKYDEQDAAAELEKINVRKARADLYAIYADALAMPKAVIYQMLVDDGDLTQEMLDLIGQQDVTPDVTATDSEPYTEPQKVPALPAVQAVVPAAPPPVPANAPPPFAKGRGDVFDGLREWMASRIGQARQEALEGESVKALRESVRALKAARDVPDVHHHHIDVHVPEQKDHSATLAQMLGALAGLVDELRRTKQAAPIVNVPAPVVHVDVKAPEGVEEHEVTERDAKGFVKRWVKRWR